MKIAILNQRSGGGTNVLLRQAGEYLASQGHEVSHHVLDLEKASTARGAEAVLLPTSEIRHLTGLLRNGIRPDRLLVWAMGHGAVTAAYYPSRTPKVIQAILDPWRKQLLASLLKDGAIVFTDAVGMSLDCLGQKRSITSELIVPIPIALGERGFDWPAGAAATRFSWIGRIDEDFKILPLLKVMDDLEQHSVRLNARVTLDIVGVGGAMDRAKHHSESLSNLDVNWLGAVDYDRLPEVISASQVLIAMGSSVLVGAANGMPSIIVKPFSTRHDRPTHSYRWIYDTVGFSMGEFPGPDISPIQPDKSFTDLWDGEELRVKAEKSWNYASSFESASVLHSLQRHLENSVPSQSTFRLSGILWFLDNVRSVRNNIISGAP